MNAALHYCLIFARLVEIIFSQTCILSDFHYLSFCDYIAMLSMLIYSSFLPLTLAMIPCPHNAFSLFSAWARSPPVADRQALYRSVWHITFIKDPVGIYMFFLFVISFLCLRVSLLQILRNCTSSLLILYVNDSLRDCLHPFMAKSIRLLHVCTITQRLRFI